MFDSFSKEELHQIGRTFIEKAQNYVDNQQETRASRPSRLPPHLVYHSKVFRPFLHLL
jgi:hypothetical protein